MPVRTALLGKMGQLVVGCILVNPFHDSSDIRLLFLFGAVIYGVVYWMVNVLLKKKKGILFACFNVLTYLCSGVGRTHILP